MQPRQIFRWFVFALTSISPVLSSSPKENSLLKLNPVRRYAEKFDGFPKQAANSRRVSDSWERMTHGLVRGGYTLVDNHGVTRVQYTVDPLGDMTVSSQIDGRPVQRTKHRLGAPLAGDYIPPFYKLLHMFDYALEYDDDDDDEDYFYDDVGDWE